MNIEWGSGYQGPPVGRLERFENRSSNDRHSLSNDRRDALRLHNYNGPYDRRLLYRSQENLLSYIERRQGSAAWRMIGSKTNIHGFSSRRSYDGYGEASTIYSHAGNPSCWNVENNDSDKMPVLTTCISDDDNDDDDCIVINEPRKSADDSETNTGRDVASTSKSNVDETLSTKMTETKGRETGSDLVDLTNDDNDSDDDVIVETPEADCVYFSTENKVDLVKGGDSVNKANVKNNSFKAIVKTSSMEPDVVLVEDNESSREGNIVIEESSSNDSSKSVSNENTNETESCTINVNINGDEMIKKETDLLKMYQCEYCQIFFESSIDMMTHMRHELHHSASCVLANPDDKSVVFMQSPTELTYKPAMYQKLVANCPVFKCRSIFPDVNSCVLHSILCHKEPVECYALSEVLSLDYFYLNDSEYFICDKCDYSTKNIKKLLSHFNKKNHSPFQKYDNCSVYYICGHCDKVVSSLPSGMRHVLKQHGRETNLRVAILSLSNDKRVVEFPPYTKDKDGERNSIKSKIKSLRSAKGFKGKKRKQKYKDQMEMYKKFLSSL